MKLSVFASIILLFYFFPQTVRAQADSIEVYLIDAYATPELPHKFKLSFFTSDVCKSSVVIDNRYTYIVSADYSDMHKTEIDLSGLKFKGKIINFVIVTEDTAGNTYRSETFDFDLPFEPEVEDEANLFKLCLFGGAVFLLPYPNLVIQGSDTHFSLTKEIPVISFRSKSFNYPSGFISLEYTYVFNSSVNNYLRAGYKKIYELPHIEYIMPGVTLYTNFSGSNGVGIEVSLGLFTIAESFTVYGRYRYNIKPGDSSVNFSEVSFGLYTSLLSFYVN